MDTDQDLPMFDSELDEQLSEALGENDLRRGRVAGLRMAQELQVECEKLGGSFQVAINELISFEESKCIK